MFYIYRMNELTKAEEKVLQIIWAQEPTYMKDILDAYEEPRPAKTTLATILKRVIDKGFVSYKMAGSIRQYYSVISKHKFLKFKMRNLIHGFFDNSPSQFVSFFSEEMDLTKEELEQLKNVYKSKSDRKGK